MEDNIKGAIPRERHSVLKWYGWGYKNTKFQIRNNTIYFEGDRYSLNGLELPYLTEWVGKKFGVVVKDQLSLPSLPSTFPSPTLCQSFIQNLKKKDILYSAIGIDRLIRSHGQTLHDIFSLWNNNYKRIADLVVWPRTNNEVVYIVNLAHEYEVVIIPFGGGTSVSGSISCPTNETRMIAILDMSEMKKMLWFNRENSTVCFEAGIIGQDLERKLNRIGYTLGHEPDSYEFSTLGGWVATRASGMKKNLYGNIEDLVSGLKMVTVKGILEKTTAAPRVSCGPDFNHIVMGSEGTLGVITEVVIRVRPCPPSRKYGSIVFPNFEKGIKFLREVARKRCQPASIRLMDHEQFQFGQCLRTENSWTNSYMDGLKKWFICQIKKIDLNQICATTLLFEGDLDDVKRQESLIYNLAKKYNGFPGGVKNGERGYILTFVIAYIRDFALSNEIVAESFETSVPWDRSKSLCKNVKSRIIQECAQRNIQYFLISCRITQIYDTGCCIYFYFAFRYIGFLDPVLVYEEIERAARNEILASGGSLSHHHGVGKIRSEWYSKSISDVGVALYRAAKMELDPKNIFASGNLLHKSYKISQKSKL